MIESKIKLFFNVFYAVIATIIVSVYLANILTPWSWLPADGLNKLDGISIAVSLSTLIVSINYYLREIMKTKEAKTNEPLHKEIRLLRHIRVFLL